VKRHFRGMKEKGRGGGNDSVGSIRGCLKDVFIRVAYAFKRSNLTGLISIYFIVLAGGNFFPSFLFVSAPLSGQRTLDRRS